MLLHNMALTVTNLTADAVNPSPKRPATRCHVSADGLKFAEEIASKSIFLSRSAFHWYGMIAMVARLKETEQSSAKPGEERN